MIVAVNVPLLAAHARRAEDGRSLRRTRMSAQRRGARRASGATSTGVRDPSDAGSRGAEIHQIEIEGELAGISQGLTARRRLGCYRTYSSSSKSVNAWRNIAVVTSPRTTSISADAPALNDPRSATCAPKVSTREAFVVICLKAE